MTSSSKSESIYWFPADSDFGYLHGKAVQFQIVTAEFYVSGTGLFRVREQETGEQCVEITATVRQFSATRATQVFRLLPDYVAHIRRHPDPKLAEYQLVFNGE